MAAESAGTMSVARETPVMRVTLRRAAVGAYGLWLLAVLLLLLGRFTPAPLLPGVHPGVVVGAAVFTLIGAGQLLRRGYRWLAA